MKGNEDEHSYTIVGYIVSADFTRHAPCRQTGVKIAPFLVVNSVSANITILLANHDREMDSDANAPDSWDSLDDPGPGDTSEGASDLTEKLHSLNVNAKPFVPNVNAPVFVPSFLKTQAADGKILFFICLVNFDIILASFSAENVTALNFVES